MRQKNENPAHHIEHEIAADGGPAQVQHRKHQIKGVCFHDLRHTALTNLFLNKSLSVPEVMLISGHSDPRILLRTYTNLKAQDLADKIG